MLLLRGCRTGPVLERGDGLGPGHALDPREPVDAIAAFAAAEAMEVIGVDLAAGLWDRRGTGTTPARSASIGSATKSVSGASVSPEAGEEVLVGAARDGRIGRGGGDEDIDRALDDLLLRLRWRRFSRLRRLEIELAAVHLAAERQARGPCRRLQQQREHLLLGDGALRRLDDDLVVAVKHNRPAARLEPDDGGRQQIARGALHHVLDQRSRTTRERASIDRVRCRRIRCRDRRPRTWCSA